MHVRFAPWRALEGSASRGEPDPIGAAARLRRRCALRGVLLAAVALGAFAGGAAQASAQGLWMQVSCMNPPSYTGPQVATDAGWSSANNLPAGEIWSSDASAACAPGSPMVAYLGGYYQLNTGSMEWLEYQPPSTSTIAGGSLNGSISTIDTGVMPAVAYFSSPSMAGADWFGNWCDSGYAGGCGAWSGTAGIPDSTSPGDIYAIASCGGSAWCGANGGAAYSEVQVNWADILLANTSTPTGTGFTGGLLQANAAGTQDVLLTATAPGGPGVYNVTAKIDGKVVYDATPNANAGACASVGTDSSSGAWMFDAPQPCLQTENVDIPVDTTQLTDGSHQLKIVVTDAAGNSSTVYDNTITTLNHAQSSLPPTPPPTPSAASSVAQPPVYGFVLNSATTALGSAVHRSYPKSSLTFSGTLTTGGTVAPGVTVSLWSAQGLSGQFGELTSTTTDGAGRWSLTAPQGSTRALRVVAGSSASSTSSSSVVTLTETVTPTLSLKIRSLTGERLVFTGKLGISPLGSPPPIVLIEAKEDGQWQTIGKQVRVRKTGTFRLSYQTSPLLTGRSFAFRAVTVATSNWLGASSTARTAVVQ